MRLLGVSTGTVRDQVIDGATVRTAYVKTAAPQPWLITPTGVGGDEVAVHSDHLYAFDRASYAYWSEDLGRTQQWPDGWFAENLTVDALDLDALHVGDVLTLGQARLVVTGPRVPCWKLSWRMDQPKTFVRRFRLSGRSGVYLGVLEPGHVRPGDEMVVVERAPGAPTVAEVARVCTPEVRVSAREREQVAAALACEHLSPTVRMTLTPKVAGMQARDARGVDRWPGWRPFTVVQEAGDGQGVTSFTLAPRDGSAPPPFDAGQHVTVRARSHDGDDVVRTWSLSS